MNALIENRRSIRKYQSGKQVTKEQLTQLLNAAMLAPSARNTRPWEFIAITNRKVLDDIMKIHPYAQMLETAAAAIIVVGLPQCETSQKYFPQDCAAATENILLEAVSLGLGTCWCGVYPNEERVNALQKLLQIPLPKVPFNVIAVGVPDENPGQRGFYDKAKATFLE